LLVSAGGGGQAYALGGQPGLSGKLAEVGGYGEEVLKVGRRGQVGGHHREGGEGDGNDGGRAQAAS
jgi:hypothetical protein